MQTKYRTLDQPLHACRQCHPQTQTQTHPDTRWVVASSITHCRELVHRLKELDDQVDVLAVDVGVDDVEEACDLGDDVEGLDVVWLLTQVILHNNINKSRWLLCSPLHLCHHPAIIHSLAYIFP